MSASPFAPAVPSAPDLLSHALRYVALGWPVIPLNGKVPRTANGSHDGSVAPDQIREWWQQWPTANIGLCTGHRFWVLDVDAKSGGYLSLEELEAQHGRLPDTIQQITGGGGKHMLFRIPERTSIANSASLVAPGIDVKGTSGYIVAAPSVHPTTGRRYEWDGIEEIEHQRILDAPEWLIAMLTAKRAQHGHAEVVQAKIPKGRQHATLVSIAGSMRRRGLEADEIYAALEVINQHRCEEPGPDVNIRRIADSICKYPPGKPVPTHAIPEADQDAPAVSGPRMDWRDLLITSNSGKPVANIANVSTALRCAPEWAGVLAYNAFTMSTVKLKAPPIRSGAAGEWTDADDIATAEWMQRESINVIPGTVADAVQAVASERTYHPVKDYLESCKWDARPRLNTWLTQYLGCEDTPYIRAVGARWMISAVARIYQPGAKADCCLILEGEQGAGKSTALKVLGSPWFTDEIADLGSKDAAMQARGIWIIEIAELDGMGRSDVGRVKAFMTRTTDRFRPPYGRRLIDSPRQCIFAGSVNHSTYLRDETGARRFWPVACGTAIDIKGLADAKDQLWAEAVACYRSNYAWWLDTAELTKAAEEQQAIRYEGDPWDEVISAWVSAPAARWFGQEPAGPMDSDAESVTVQDILTHCIGKRQDQWTQVDKNRVARSLRALGFERYRRRARSGDGLQWRYRRSDWRDLGHSGR
jgi:predicted P-loop ATPase